MFLQKKFFLIFNWRQIKYRFLKAILKYSPGTARKAILKYSPGTARLPGKFLPDLIRQL